MTDAEWSAAEPHIARALVVGGEGYRPEDVRERIESGEARLWRGEGAALVTVTYDEASERVLHLWLAGGDMDELVTKLRPEAEAWAVGQGCGKAVIVGRKGWTRALGGEGYIETARVIEKVL